MMTPTELQAIADSIRRRRPSPRVDMSPPDYHSAEALHALADAIEELADDRTTRGIGSPCACCGVPSDEQGSTAHLPWCVEVGGDGDMPFADTRAALIAAGTHRPGMPIKSADADLFDYLQQNLDEQTGGTRVGRGGQIHLNRAIPIERPHDSFVTAWTDYVHDEPVVLQIGMTFVTTDDLQFIDRFLPRHHHHFSGGVCVAEECPDRTPPLISRTTLVNSVREAMTRRMRRNTSLPDLAEFAISTLDDLGALRVRP